MKDNAVSVLISKKIVFINSACSAATHLLNVSVLVWMYNYLLERIPPEQFAIYAVVFAVMAFAPLFSVLLTGGVSRYIIDAYARNDTGRVTEILSSIFPPLVGAGLALLFSGLVLSWHIGEVLTIPAEYLGDARLMMVLLVFAFVYRMVLVPYGVGFNVKQRFVLLNGIYISRDLVRIALLFILLLGVSTRVLWVVVASVTADLVAVTVITWWSRRMIPQLRFNASLFNLRMARLLVSFGFWTTLGQVAAMVHNSTGTLVLNKLGTPLAVTAYYVGSMVDRQTSRLTSFASVPLQPALTAMYSGGDRRRLGNTYLRGGRYALWATLAIGCPLMIYSSEFIRLYLGDRYLEAATVITLLAATYPFTYSNFFLAQVAMATARVKSFFVAAFITQVISVGLMIYLVEWWQAGATGVSAAICATLIISQLVCFWPMALRLAEVSFFRFVRETLLPGMGPAAGASVIWLGLKLYDPPDTWLTLAIYALAGYLIYAVVLYTACLQAQERADIIGAVKAFAHRALPRLAKSHLPDQTSRK